MDVFKTRLANLRQLVKEWSGPANLAAKLGYANASYVVQMAGPHPIREISEKTARKIEGKLGLEAGYLDRQHTEKSKSVNESKVVYIVRAVGAVLQDSKIILPPETFADVVSLVYDHEQLTGAVDEAYIRKIVALLGTK